MKGEDPARAIRNELRFELDRARKITSDLCRMLDHVRAMYKPCPDCVFDAAMAEALTKSEAKCERYRVALADLLSEVAQWIECEFIMPGDDYVTSFLQRHGIDPASIEGAEVTFDPAPKPDPDQRLLKGARALAAVCEGRIFEPCPLCGVRDSGKCGKSAGVPCEHPEAVAERANQEGGSHLSPAWPRWVAMYGKRFRCRECNAEFLREHIFPRGGVLTLEACPQCLCVEPDRGGQ